MSYQLARVEERNVTQNETPGSQDRAKFGISCKAGGVTTLTTTADSLAIEAAVRISRSNATELWPCVGIYSREEEDGSLEGNDLNSQASVLFLPRVNPTTRPELRRIRTGNGNRRFNGKRISGGGERSYTHRLPTRP